MSTHLMQQCFDIFTNIYVFFRRHDRVQPPIVTVTATVTSSGPSAFTVATVQEEDAVLAEALASFERKGKCF